MSKIKVLDPITYNQISAGEVVERPSSVVKELVENSIDAGCETISIFITNGGRNITVIDDGVGMSRVDARNCFYKHATSKITKSEDLENISTFGFRGEAIPSIASVSMMTIRTRYGDDEFGTEIISKGGLISELKDCGLENGTEVIVENLFFNTPVREKFLKAEKSEEREITVMVEKLILANPYVAFNYYLNGKKIYSVPGKNLETAVFEIYNGDYIENSHFINVVRNNISIKGYYSKIDFTKGNRTYQSTFVNGRYVKNETLSQSLNTAFKPFVMKKNFPFFVMHFDFLPGFVDVNVSPTKTDVRFENQSLVFGTIYKVITGFLKSETSKDMDCGISGEFDLEENKKRIQYIHRFTPSEVEKIRATPLNAEKPFCPILYNWPDVELRAEPTPARAGKTFTVELDFEPKEEIPKYPTQSLSSQMYDDALIKDVQPELTQEDKSNIIREWQQEMNITLNKDDIRIVGTIFSTYIIVQSGDKLLMIDQHAAHETFLYEDFRKEVLSKDVLRQELLVPYVLNLNPIEEDFIHTCHYQFMDIGFTIYPTDDDGKYEIWEMPQELVGMNIDEFFNDVFSEIERFKCDLPKYVTLDLTSKACKHAVKAGKDLSMFEIERVVEKLKDSVDLKCPHGRPVVVTISIKEVEKWFKRRI